MKIEIPTVTPEVLDAVANVYSTAAQVMRGDRNDEAELLKEAEALTEPVEVELVEEPFTPGDDTVDARGIMYDPELHTRTKSLDDAGNWKKKRTLTDEEVARRERKPGDPEPEPVPEEPATAEPAEEVDENIKAAEPYPQNIGDLMRWCSENNIKTPDVMGVLTAKGIDGLVGLDGNPTLIAEVCAELLA